MDGLGPLPPGQPRAALVAEVLRVLATISVGRPAVLAFSGGPDSTALAHLVAEARPDLELRLLHVRHGLRDDREDLEVVRLHAGWLGLPLDEVDVEVLPEGQGLEAAARTARYEALREAATAHGGAPILLGHTAEDQAETVLLRLARGTGLDGLGAMPEVRGELVRPLLRLRRGDVHRFVELEGLPHAQDPTNRSPQIRRSTVRHHLLPVLEEVAPDPVGALVRLADLAQADAAALDVASRSAVAQVRSVGPVRTVPLEVLQVDDPASVAVARRVVRHVLTALVGEPPDAGTVQRVLLLEPGSAASLPGPIEVSSAGGWCTFAPRTLPEHGPVTVEAPGRHAWPPAAASIALLDPTDRRAEPELAGPVADDVESAPVGQVAFDLPGAWHPPAPDPHPALLPPGAVPQRLVLALPTGIGPLVVRRREPGDHVATAAGTRSLQDLLVDVGLPRAIRDLWPVVAHDDGRVLWVPGYAADESVLRAGRRAPAAQLRVASDPAAGAVDANEPPLGSA